MRDNYQSFAKALPDSRVFYAVKANPAPEVLSLLASMGSCFDTATVAEIKSQSRLQLTTNNEAITKLRKPRQSQGFSFVPFSALGGKRFCLPLRTTFPLHLFLANLVLYIAASAGRRKQSTPVP